MNREPGSPEPASIGAKTFASAEPARVKRIGDHIGSRIRERRTELGLTQEQLGTALGVSYQQIQKYETAANRVSAGRLYELACAFGVEVSYFFDGLEEAAADGPLPHGGHNRAAIELVRNFLALDDGSLKMAVSGLLKALREQRNAEPPPQGDGTVS
jgi:transcriptional regulator with XRE-family HTH domain